MPKNRHLTLLLLATHAFSASAWAAGASEGSVAIEWNANERRGVSSVGPRGIGRKADRLVEPASFYAAVPPKPLTEPPPVEEGVNKEVALPPPQPLGTPEANDTAKPIVAEPADSTEPVTPSPQDAGRCLGFAPSAPIDERRESSLMKNPLEGLLAWRPSSQQLTATGGGLAIAIGLLLSTVWLVRSCAPKSSRPLPRDVVEVLGRAPLGSKQTTQLVRVGSKLVLIAVTPDGAKALTEVTDPGEVQRLIAACESNNGRGSSADFDQMLLQMSNEPAERGFLGAADRGNEPRGFGAADASFDPRSLAAAYANTPGGRGDG